MVATEASPVTFTTVLNMSRGLSIPKIRAIPSTGIPTDVSTTISITILPPGIPGVPIEEMVAVSIIVSVCPTVKSISNT